MPSQNPIHSDVFDLVTTIIPDPGLGAQFSIAVPTNSRVQIDYIGFLLNTSAVAADRFPTILGVTPTLSQTLGASSIAQAANPTYGWAFVAGLPETQDLSANNIVVVPMSPNLILEPGDTLESMVINLQGGDLISSIITRYKQWVIA